MKKTDLISVLAAAAMLAALTGCGAQPQSAADPLSPVSTDSAAPAETESAAESQSAEAAAPETDAEAEFDPDTLASFAVTSDNLHDGVWDSVITNTENGQNRSPQLAWDPVPDAGCYAVYMVDTTVDYWLHWKSGGITETTLPLGWAPETEYIGPYPPGGTHTYEIFVFALKKPLGRIKGAFNSSNPVFRQKTLPSLDITDDGESGNILACGHISGTYTKGE